jgi:hypothetical protein
MLYLRHFFCSSDEADFPLSSERVFWGLPYFFPMHTLMSKTYLLPEVPPFQPPTQISVKVRWSLTQYRRCHGQADYVKKKHYSMIVTENTKYALRVAHPRVADRPAGGGLPEGRIVKTPYRPTIYYPFSVCLVMAATYT